MDSCTFDAGAHVVMDGVYSSSLGFCAVAVPLSFVEHDRGDPKGPSDEGNVSAQDDGIWSYSRFWIARYFMSSACRICTAVVPTEFDSVVAPLAQPPALRFQRSAASASER